MYAHANALMEKTQTEEHLENTEKETQAQNKIVDVVMTDRKKHNNDDQRRWATQNTWKNTDKQSARVKQQW